MACSNDILQNVPANVVLLARDESHYQPFGCFNKQHFHYWAENKSCQLSELVNVWCTFAKFGVLRPYSFEVELLRKFLEPKRKDLENSNVWFHQDGSITHTARRSMETLKEMLPQYLISLRSDIGLPACSPDIPTRNNCFLWRQTSTRSY